MKNHNLDQALESYSATTTFSKKTVAKAIGFGAAIATGLLTGSQAEADIIFNSTGGGGAVDIDGDGNVDLFFGILNGLGATDSDGGFGIDGTGTKGGFAFQGNGAAFPSPYRQAVSSGSVNSANVNTAGIGWMGWVSSGAATSDAWGIFSNPGVTQTGLVGFQFNGSSKNGATAATMNGWIQLAALWDDTVGATAGVIEDGEILTGAFSWAYNDDPTSTDNGQTADGTKFTGVAGGIHVGAVANAVPEPSSGVLALLALGAVGVRRRKKAA